MKLRLQNKGKGSRTWGQQNASRRKKPTLKRKILGGSVGKEFTWASQVAVVITNPPANARDAGDMSSTLRSGRSTGKGNGNPFQYSCLENSVDGGDLSAIGSCKESDTTEHTCILQKQPKTIHVDIWQYQHNIVKQFLFN